MGIVHGLSSQNTLLWHWPPRDRPQFSRRPACNQVRVAILDRLLLLRVVHRVRATTRKHINNRKELLVFSQKACHLRNITRTFSVIGQDEQEPMQNFSSTSLAMPQGARICLHMIRTRKARMSTRKEEIAAQLT